MKTAIRKMGNSQGVLLPKPLLKEIGAKPGDTVDISVKAGRLLIVPERKKPRAGWAEDSKRLKAAGEGGPVWPEFSNKADKALEW